MINKNIAIKLREGGKTYQEIAKILGVSRQRIHQICNPRVEYYLEENEPKNIFPFGYFRDIGRLSKSERKMVAIYQSQGWNVIRDGIPDFLLWKWDKEKRTYVWEWRETKKDKNTSLTFHQKKVFEIFKLLNFPLKIDLTNEYTYKGIKSLT